MKPQDRDMGKEGKGGEWFGEGRHLIELRHDMMKRGRLGMVGGKGGKLVKVGTVYNWVFGQ